MPTTARTTRRASVARSGAEVIERRDLAKQGKGYALDFALAHLDANPPDIVIVIDADCRVSDGAIEDDGAKLAPQQAGRCRFST